jgi:hypothetical protein
MGHNANKKRAVRAALARLGMQARPAEVVAALASWGVTVSEAMVRAVAFELRRGRSCAGSWLAGPASHRR